MPRKTNSGHTTVAISKQTKAELHSTRRIVEHQLNIEFVNFDDFISYLHSYYQETALANN